MPIADNPTVMPASGSRGAGVAGLLPRVLLVALAFLLGCFCLADYDIWWHLRTGQLIPERGVPITDWYSFTSAENPWIDVHWGFQLLIGWLHEVGGVPAMVFVKAVVGALAFLVALMAYRRHWPTTVQVLVWLPALLLMSSRFYVRPEIFTLLFLAIYLAVLFYAEERPALLWLLVPVQLLWANCHGLFILGPVLLGMYWVEALLRLNAVRGLFRHLVPVTALVALASLASPYRFGNVLLVAELWLKMGEAEGKLFRDHVAELESIERFWKHGGFTNPYVWLHLGLLAVSVLSIIVALPAILRERRAFRVLPILAFGWLGLQATRNSTQFALVAATATCWNLGSLPRWGPPRRWTSWFCVALILLVGWYVGSSRWYLAVGGQRRFGFAEQPNFVSHAGMKLAGAKGMPNRAAVFNFGHAAVYILHNSPERKVLMDGRLEVHSAEMFRTYMDLESALASGQNFDAVLRGFQIDLVLADGEHNHAIQAVLLGDPAWRCVYYDEVLGVFLRRSVPLPTGVTEYSFRDALFARPIRLFDKPMPEPTAPPRWLLFAPPEIYSGAADLASARLFYLGLGLSARGGADASGAQAVLWRAAQTALEAIERRPFHPEGYRHFGACLETLSGLLGRADGPAEAAQRWDVCTGIIPAMALAALERARRCDPYDATSCLLLSQIYARIGAKDKGLEPLQRLANRWTVNRAQIELAKDAPKVLAELLQQVQSAQTRVDPRDQTFAGLERYAAAGILGAGLDRVELSQILKLAPNQADRVGTWFLLLGRADEARQVYRQLEGQNRLPTDLVELRLGCCDQIDGRFAEARARYLRAMEIRADSVEALSAMAVLNVLAGDRDQVASYLQRALAARPTPAQAKMLRQLETLLAGNRGQ